MSEPARALPVGSPAVEQAVELACRGVITHLTVHGERVAAIVPESVIEAVRAGEDAEDAAEADVAMDEAGESVSWEQVKQSLICRGAGRGRLRDRCPAACPPLVTAARPVRAGDDRSGHRRAWPLIRGLRVLPRLKETPGFLDRPRLHSSRDALNIASISRRLWMLIFSNTDLRWSWTVWREMNRRSVTARVSRPATSAAATSRSRGESP